MSSSHGTNIFPHILVFLNFGKAPWVRSSSVMEAKPIYCLIATSELCRSMNRTPHCKTFSNIARCSGQHSAPQIVQLIEHKTHHDIRIELFVFYSWPNHHVKAGLAISLFISKENRKRELLAPTPHGRDPSFTVAGRRSMSVFW